MAYSATSGFLIVTEHNFNHNYLVNEDVTYNLQLNTQ